MQNETKNKFMKFYFLFIILFHFFTLIGFLYFTKGLMYEINNGRNVGFTNDLESSGQEDNFIFCVMIIFIDMVSIILLLTNKSINKNLHIFLIFYSLLSFFPILFIQEGDILLTIQKNSNLFLMLIFIIPTLIILYCICRFFLRLAKKI